MRKLYYNIYSNISDDEYFAIQDRLVVIEEELVALLKNNGWNLREHVAKDDGLAIDFFKNESHIYGSFSIVFNDLPGAATFSSGITKSFNENDIRYLKRHYFFKRKDLSFFENKLSKLVDRALRRYDSWSKEEIRHSGLQIAIRRLEAVTEKI
jgi:hypothetical protein